MLIKALVTSGLNERTITAKSGKNAGKDFTFRTVNVLDLDADKQQVIEMDVHENDAAEVRSLQGKSLMLKASFFQGKFYYAGQHVKAS